MALNIRTGDHISSPNFNERDGEIRLILLHATGGTSSLGHLRNPAPKNSKTGVGDSRLAVSIHYLIDKKGGIDYMVPEEKRAWHAGTGKVPNHPEITDINDASIGIEIENLNDGKDPYPQVQLDATRDLVVDIMQRRGKLLMLRHRDTAPQRKVDPKPYAFDWQKFNDAVTEAYTKCDTSVKPFKGPWDGKGTPPIPGMQPGDIVVNATYRSLARQLPVRTKPTTQDSRIVDYLTYLEEFYVDVVKPKGENVVDTTKWLHVADGSGFVTNKHAQYVRDGR